MPKVSRILSSGGGGGVCAVVAISLFIVYCIWIIPTMVINDDEGFYAITAMAAVSGWMPYMDFTYTQMPVLPYINGLGLSLLGFGLFEQRFLNAIYLFISLFFIYKVLRGKLGRKACFVSVILVFSNPVCFANQVSGKTYGLTGLLLLGMCCVALTWNRARPVHQMILLSLLGVLSVSCRLTLLPFVGLVWLYFVWQHLSLRFSLFSIFIPIGFGVLFLGVFFVNSPELFYFWNVGYHLDYSGPERFWSAIKDLPKYAFMQLLLGLFALIRIFRNPHYLGRTESALLLSACIAVVINLLPANCYASNLVPFFGVITLSSMLVLFESESSRQNLFLNILLVVSLLQPLVIPPPLFAQQVDALEKTSRFINRNTPEDATLLCYDNLVALEAERDIYPLTHMGKFAFTAEMEVEKARSLNMLHHKDFMAIVEKNLVDVLVLSRASRAHNFMTSFPSYLDLPGEIVNDSLQTILEHYTPMYKNDFFVVLFAKNKK